jgi:diacylglycerol kinase
MIKTIKKLYLNLINSINGLKLTLKEHSFIIEILSGIILIPYLIIADLNNIFKLIIITIYFILLAFELLNTAIEKLSNKVNQNFDKDIKKIKDISSASVFVILILLIVVLILAIFVFS